LDYKCTKHKSNEGFIDNTGKWVCWLCYDYSNNIEAGDMVRVKDLPDIEDKFRNRILKVMQVVIDNDNQIMLYMIDDSPDRRSLPTIIGYPRHVEKIIK